jgi:hypothetical protein
MADATSTKVTDVAKPGTTPADPTSRPVIVGHGPMVADPMVNAEKSEETKTASGTAPQAAPGSTATSGTGSSKPKITPVSSQEEVKQDTAENDEKKLDEDLAEKKDTAEDKQARLGELIESGEYNVTIRQAKNGSVRTFLLTICIVLLLGVVAVYVLADLNILDIGVELPFEFFK